MEGGLETLFPVPLVSIFQKEGTGLGVTLVKDCSRHLTFTGKIEHIRCLGQQDHMTACTKSSVSIFFKNLGGSRVP